MLLLTLNHNDKFRTSSIRLKSHSRSSWRHVTIEARWKFTNQGTILKVNNHENQHYQNQQAKQTLLEYQNNGTLLGAYCQRRCKAKRRQLPHARTHAHEWIRQLHRHEGMAPRISCTEFGKDSSDNLMSKKKNDVRLWISGS